MSGYQPLERPLPQQQQQQQQVQMQPIAPQPSFNPNAAPSYARVPSATPVQVYAYPMLPPQQQQQQQWQYAPVVAQQPHRVQQQPLPQPQAPQLQQPMVREHPYAIPLSPDHPAYPPVGQPGHLSRGKWSDGFCDCCDSVSICLTTCVLAPVRWAQTAERLKFRSFISALFMYGIPWVLSFMLWFISPHGRRHRGDGDDDDSWDDDNGADDQSGGSSSSSGSDSMHSGHHRSVNGLVVFLIIVAVACNIITIVLGARYRGRIRKQFDIPGSACGDCMAHTCFPCCAISQEARHVDRDLAYPL